MESELSKYSIEDLQREIERREAEMAPQEEEEVSFEHYSHMHRNHGWMPLRGYRLDKDYKKWLINFLLPKLKEVTGVEWFLDSYLVKAQDVLISLPPNDDDFTIVDNDIVKKLMEKWPVLDEECFGYKLEKVEHVDFDTDVYTYKGMWAFDPQNIHDRGHIYSSSFGI